MRCQIRKSVITSVLISISRQTLFISHLLEVCKMHHSRWQPDLPYLHDAVGVVALCAPELLEFQEMTARVFGRGPFKGFMVSRIMDGPLIQAAVRINAEATREWVMERLLSPSRAQTS